ncbi:hypothetical protein MPSEU_000100700 [Mayamaea pseudoterrestris]|nr:hypothetical protein MPSEU_000100700 [Mayamaea pseudoterrestris]
MLAILLLLANTHFIFAWTTIAVCNQNHVRLHRWPKKLRATTASRSEDAHLASLKAELEKYLEVRKKADIEGQNVGKGSSQTRTVGGTKGNLILEYISGAPNVEQIVEEDPNDIFCYAELEKYDFTSLVAPIMENGGRLAMYELLGLPIPNIIIKPESPQRSSELIIDKRGETDAGRYSGLKMGLLDDSAMADALQQAQRKQKDGVPLRATIEEERYVASYRSKRNVGPRMTPDWTAQRIDDELNRQGDAISWARNARDDQLMIDDAESLDLGVLQQVYSVATAILISMSFGKATPAFLTMLGVDGASYQTSQILDVLKIPAVGLLAASLASSVLCSLKAPEKKRNPIIWTFRGLLGGPLTIGQLQQLPQLLTRAELTKQRREQS